MRKILKGFALLLLFLVIVIGIIQLIPVKKVIADNPFKKKSDGRPLIIAHGGSKDLFPENTMLAFDGSIKIGIDMLEMDVCLTKDDILITHHDLKIDTMTDGEGLVRAYTLEDLKDFNFAYGFVDLEGNPSYMNTHVPVTTLKDVFDKYPDILFNVEIKDKGADGNLAASILYELIKDYNLENRILVPSFSDENIQYFREVTNHAVMTSSAREETRSFIYMHLAQLDNLIKDLPYESMQLPLEDSGVKLATKAIIADARRRNIAIHYWTIDDPETMRELIEMGVDGIITDRPDILNEVLDSLTFTD